MNTSKMEKTKELEEHLQHLRNAVASIDKVILSIHTSRRLCDNCRKFKRVLLTEIADVETTKNFQASINFADNATQTEQGAN